jgi:hypothetical protein
VVDSDNGGAADVRNENLTGMRFFSLRSLNQLSDQQEDTTHAIGWRGLPPLQVVCTLTSFKESGGPFEEYVGVSEGSQKSGSLWRSASACSRSIWRSAASSAS